MRENGPGGCAGARASAGAQPLPPVVLVHGIAMTSALTWSEAIAPLSERFTPICVDLPGHGRPDQDRGMFTLERAADRVARSIAEAGTAPAIVVGYSLGGLVAQLVWRRHRAAVAGLVLCSTAPDYSTTPLDRMCLLAATWTAWWSPRAATPLLRAQIETIAQQVMQTRGNDAAADRLSRAVRELDPRAVAAAALAVASHRAGPWLDTVDVPTAVLVTGRDRLVAPARQRALASRIPGAVRMELDAGHGVCLTEPSRFVDQLVAACEAVDDAGRTAVAA